MQKGRWVKGVRERRCERKLVRERERERESNAPVRPAPHLCSLRHRSNSSFLTHLSVALMGGGKHATAPLHTFI